MLMLFIKEIILYFRNKLIDDTLDDLDLYEFQMFKTQLEVDSALQDHISNAQVQKNIEQQRETTLQEIEQLKQTLVVEELRRKHKNELNGLTAKVLHYDDTNTLQLRIKNTEKDI